MCAWRESARATPDGVTAVIIECVDRTRTGFWVARTR